MLAFPRKSRFFILRKTYKCISGWTYPLLKELDYHYYLRVKGCSQLLTRRAMGFFDQNYSVEFLLSNDSVSKFDKDLILLNLDFFTNVFSKNWEVDWMMKDIEKYKFIEP